MLRLAAALAVEKNLKRHALVLSAVHKAKCGRQKGVLKILNRSTVIKVASDEGKPRTRLRELKAADLETTGKYRWSTLARLATT